MKFTVRFLLASAAVTFLAGSASASIIPTGSNLTFGGFNLPGACTDTSCSDNVTFGATPILIDGGAISLYETQVADGPNAEWDVWHISTTAGGPIAGDINGNWDLLMDYDLSQAVFFDQVADQWTVDGTAVSPINNFGGLCCATTTNPILSGDAYYSSGFSAALAAGVQSNWQQIFIDPYSFASAGGIDPSTANGFNFALHFTLQTPVGAVPEPGALSLMGGGLMALFGLGLRRRKKT